MTIDKDDLLNSILSNIAQMELVKSSDIPNIDLYMDQVTTFMDQHLEKTKRYTPAEGQPVYLTHMARTLHGTQAELDASLPGPLRAARDGEEVIFKVK